MMVARQFPGVANNGEPTFAGIIQKYFTEMQGDKNIGISKNWNEKTAAGCKCDYERRIIPCLIEQCSKYTPAHELVADDFERVLEKLADANHYSDATIGHYRHLIYVAYYAGVERNLYPDKVFWVDSFDESTASEKEIEDWRIKKMTRIRKSFEVQEELKLIEYFSGLNPETARGEDVGLMLMFSLGLRNNEACGGNYSSIHPLMYYPEVKVFDMVQSTKIKSSDLKSGGKTSNAPRTLIMMEPIVDFIEKRKKYISNLLSNGQISDEEIDSVEDMPLVCKGTDFAKRVTTIELANAGRELFNKIGIDRSELIVLFQILSSTDAKQSQIDEKEPTTYLFRRNCATHLYQLGFTPSEIQYWMGHEIEDPFIKRSFYADPDQIYGLKGKWDRHPVLKKWAKSEYNEDICNSIPFRASEIEKLGVNLSVADGKQLLITAHLMEPKCGLTVSNKLNDKDIKTTILIVPKEQNYPRYANITSKVIKTYDNYFINKL